MEVGGNLDRQVLDDVDSIIRRAFPEGEDGKIWTSEADRVVDQLRAEAKSLRASVFAELKEHYESQMKEPQESDRIDALLATLSSRFGIEEEWATRLRLLAAEKMELEERILECTQIVESDRLMQGMRKKKEEIESLVRSCLFMDAASLVENLVEESKSVDPETVADTFKEELDELVSYAREVKVKLEEEIEVKFHEYVSFRSSNTLEQYEVAGLLDGYLVVGKDGVQKVLSAASVANKVLPIVKSLVDQLMDSFGNKLATDAKGMCVVLKADDGDVCRMSWRWHKVEEQIQAHCIVQNLKEVISFVSNHIFMGKGTWCSYFVSEFWSVVSSCFKTNRLLLECPQTIKEVGQLNKVMVEFADLAASLCADYDCNCSSSSVVAEGVQNMQLYYDNSMLDGLGQVRHALMEMHPSASFLVTECQAVTLSSCSFESLQPYVSESSKKNPVVEGGGYAVTSGALAAVKDIQRIAEEIMGALALGLHRDVVNYLFECLGDIVVLVIELPLGVRGIEISESPRWSLLYCNDCEHVARSLISVAYKFQARMPDESYQYFLSDLVKNSKQLYTASERCAHNQLEACISRLISTLKGMGTFQSISQPDKKRKTTLGLNMLIDQLVQLRDAWSDILPNQVYVEMMARALKCISRFLVQELLQIHDLSVDDCETLQTILLEFMEAVEKSLSSPPTQDAVVHAGLPEFSHFRLYMSSEWGRLEAFSDLLGSKLREIVENWELGELQNRGLTSGEVQKFVKMVFSDTPRREDALSRIRRTVVEGP